MIPLVDLKAQYFAIKKDIDRALVDTLGSGQFIHGSQVQTFEKNFASYIGTRYCIGLNSGTDALTLGLRSMDYQQGDEVIVPANTYISSVSAINENKYRPVFVDIQDDDFGFDLTDLHKKITPRTRAIIVSHMFGLPDKLDEIKDILNEADHHIDLIEDFSYAHGAEYKGKKVGTFGVFTACSFHPTKNLGALGDAGALLTNSPKIERLVRLMHDHGQDRKHMHNIMGVSSQMDEMQAAVLGLKLQHLNQWNATRGEIAIYYTKLLNERLPFIKLPSGFSDRTHVYNAFIIRLPERDRLMAFMKRHHVQTAAYYATPMHLQRATMHLEYTEGSMPVAELCANDMLSIPMYPELTAEQCRQVVNTIAEFYEQS